MSEVTKQMRTATSDSALAITESRATTQRRPGGCVGIFFQLLDWNRRFTKKKIFTKKFLGQARSKPAAVSTGHDEPLYKTKFHLAEENTSRRVSNVKKRPCGGRSTAVILHNQHDTEAVGLVARLMGLESLPGSNNKFRSPGDDTDLVKKDFKSAQLKSILSSSKRHRHGYQPKLGSPRSPTLESARNAVRTSKLIGAATKILEPGLQATNRSRNAIGNSVRVNYVTTSDFLTGTSGNGDIVTELLKKHQEEQNSAFHSSGLCKNCGNLNGTLVRSDKALSYLESDIPYPLYGPDQDKVTRHGSTVDFPENKERSPDKLLKEHLPLQSRTKNSCGLSRSKLFGRFDESYIAAEMKTPRRKKKVGFSTPVDNRIYERSLRQQRKSRAEMSSYTSGTQSCESISFPKWNNLDEESSPFRRKRTTEIKGSPKKMHRSLVSKEAALGQFLEDKLRELASYKNDNLDFDAVSRKKSVATLLQELITALSREQTSMSPTKVENCDALIKEKIRVNGLPKNESFSDHHEDKSVSGEMNQSSRESTSLLTHMMDSVTDLLNKINQSCGSSISSQMFNAKEVITNAELIFLNATKSNPNSLSFFLQFCLLDEVDTFAVAISTYIGSLAFAASKGKTKLRRFLFDCLIEFLQLKYIPVFSMSWRRLPCYLDTSMLIDEVAMEVHRWTTSGAVIPEMDMNQLSSKTTVFELDVLETCVDIGNDILQVLVHEVILEL